MPRVVLVSLLLIPLIAKPARAVDKKQLQKLILMPEVTTNYSISVEGNHLVVCGQASPKVWKEALEKKLKGPNPDAQDFVDLANLYSADKNTTKSEEILKQAEEHFRQRVRKQPNQPESLAQLAEILLEQQRQQEAATLLRKATRSGQPSSRAWTGLAWFHIWEAREALMPQKERKQLPNRDAFFKSLEDHREKLVESGNLKRANECLAQARECLDQAVKAAPKEGRPYRDRFLASIVCSFEGALVNALDGKFQADFMKAFCSREFKKDLHLAFQLDPNDLPSVAFLVFTELHSVMALAQERDAEERQPRWEDLPEPDLQDVHRALKRLEEWTSHDDKTISGACAEMLGICHYQLDKNGVSAGVFFRKALDIDPGRELSRLGLEFCLDHEHKMQERIELCVERVRLADSAKSRFALVASYFDDAKFDQAEKECRLALKNTPKDGALTLALAAVLLKSSERKIPFTEVKRLLTEAEQSIGKDGPREQLRQLALLRGLCHGLRGQVADARERILQAEALSDDPIATRSALAALEK